MGWNETAAQCVICKGVCCRAMPGVIFPDDVTPGQVKEMLASGRYAIDWWEGDPREGMDELPQAEYLRPAIKGMEGWQRDPSWGGECTFLTPTGCELAYENRPRECRGLIPGVDGPPCFTPPAVSKKAAAIAWLPLRAFLLALEPKEEQDTSDPAVYLRRLLDQIRVRRKQMGLTE